MASRPHSSQQLLAYAQATYSWEAGQKTEDELLQRIWNLADDVGRLVEQLETAQQRVAFWKNQARRARMTDGICGVTVDSSWHEPVACAFGPDHEGDHSWASIPAHNPAFAQDSALTGGPDEYASRYDTETSS